MYSAESHPLIYCYGHTNVTVLTTPSGERQAFYQIESQQTKRTQWYPFDGIPPQMDVNVFAPYRRDFLAKHGNYGTPELQQMAQRLDSLNIQPASGEPRRRKDINEWIGSRESLHLNDVEPEMERYFRALNLSAPQDVIRYANRDIVVLLLPSGPQPFYRSTGHNSKKPGAWLPFDGVVPHPMAPNDPEHCWFSKAEYGGLNPQNSAFTLHRHGDREKLVVGEKLEEMNLPTGREVNREAVNIFINTPYSLEANEKFRKMGGMERPTWGVQPSRDAYDSDGKPRQVDIYTEMFRQAEPENPGMPPVAMPTPRPPEPAVLTAETFHQPALPPAPAHVPAKPPALNIVPSREILNYNGYDVVMLGTDGGPVACFRPYGKSHWVPTTGLWPYDRDPSRGIFNIKTIPWNQRDHVEWLLQQLENLNLPRGLGRNANKEAINIFIGEPHINELYERENTYRKPTFGVDCYQRFIWIDPDSPVERPAAKMEWAPHAPVVYMQQKTEPFRVTTRRVCVAGLTLFSIAVVSQHFFAEPYHFRASKPSESRIVDPASFAEMTLEPRTKKIFTILMRDPASNWEKRARWDDFSLQISGREVSVEKLANGNIRVSDPRKTVDYPKNYVAVIQMTDEEGNLFPNTKENIFYAYSQLRYPDKPNERYGRIMGIIKRAQTIRGFGSQEDSSRKQARPSLVLGKTEATPEMDRRPFFLKRRSAPRGK